MRRIRPLLLLAATLAVSSLAACRDGGGGGGDDQPTPDGPINVSDVDIRDIQDPAGPVAEGTIVNIRGAVVTAIDTYGTRTGNIFIQEPDGGPYSGVLVFNAPLDVVATLQVGDLVDLGNAEKQEFALVDDTSGRKVTELGPPMGGDMTLVKVGSGAAPTPEVVDALAIGMMPEAARDAEWEKWEGVLIRVDNVTVGGNVRQIGSTAQDPPFVEFAITGGLRVDTSLAAFPASLAEGMGGGLCLGSITGIGDYFFNYKLLPRTTADISENGTGCPTEVGATACHDTLDNDGNGFVDCADFSCQRDMASGCQVAATVSSIQMGTTTGTVSLSNVVVTAIGVNNQGVPNQHIWVADALQAAQYNGIHVFRTGALPAGVVVGAVVNVTGNVIEFDQNAMGETVTEVTGGVVTFVSAPAGAPVPLALTGAGPAGTIGAPGEPFEGVLVSLQNMKVTMDAGNGKLRLTDNAGGVMVIDDEAFRYNSPTPIAVDTCFSSLVGVMDLQVFDDVRTLLPRSAADMVVGAGCN
ncbi:MAG: hypothetical protein KA297_16920 [Kofleriaceae bacterium]|nr:hypothetical protein [Kofleriaceae bacterium]MBP6836714.1 hypothetical protein [Kofleriaceae bacterium]